MGFFRSGNPKITTEGYFGGATGGATAMFSLPSVSVGSTGPSQNGPGQSFAGGATSGVFPTPSGRSGGAISPDPFTIHGVGVVAFGQFSTAPLFLPPTGQGFVLILNQAGLAQNFFTGLSFTLGSGNSYNLTTAAAMFNHPWDDTATGTGYTTWVWPSAEAFFPPASWPNPITVDL